MSGYSSWEFSFSERTFITFFLLFLSSALFSLIVNGLLFFLTVRCKQQLWQSQFILIKIISVCGFGITILSTFISLSSILCEQTQFFGHWCIMQFCVLRFFFLTSQMTLALMAKERYIFICHSIHYQRMVHSRSACISLGLICLVSGALSIQGGLVLNQKKEHFQQQTRGLLCSAIAIKELILFSWKDDLLLFGPSSVIAGFCLLIFCYCYGCMYKAALTVCKALQHKNLRATRTVGLYLLMFLLQMAPNTFFVILTLLGRTKSSFLSSITPMLTPILITIPSCIQAFFLIIRNPQIKQVIYSRIHRKDHIRKEQHTCQVEGQQPDVSPPNPCSQLPENEIPLNDV